ncbi:hypothetical protein ACFU98_32455 [Streptomyces sp. NPDC057575]|uniref:hypothetical protein n=1 Tax=unclassified Streptomyces TaxID=2593676 RepID=UPI0036771AD4
MSERVREAIEVTIDDLTPVERAALARFTDLVDRRRVRAGAALYAQTRRELGLG